MTEHTRGLDPRFVWHVPGDCTNNLLRTFGLPTSAYGHNAQDPALIVESRFQRGKQSRRAVAKLRASWRLVVRIRCARIVDDPDHASVAAVTPIVVGHTDHVL